MEKKKKCVYLQAIRVSALRKMTGYKANYKLCTSNQESIK